MEHSKPHGYNFYTQLGSPRYICAPMVDQSDLAFRMQVRKHGCQLCWTPMYHSRMMVENKGYKNKVFKTCKEDRPLVVQLCGNKPETITEAAKMVQDECDAVDINLGCPQGIARKGHYGSFLLSEPDLICSMVEKMSKELKIPVLCKIRILPEREATLQLCKRLEKAGCSILTVHGRTKEQNKHKTGKCDWDIIKKIKEELSIPVFANGGIHSFEDVQKCLEETGVDGVMSSEALLENPALFSGEVKDLDQLAAEYVKIWKEYDGERKKFLKPHLFKFLYKGLKENTDLRERLGKAKELEEYEAVIKELTERRKNLPKKMKFGWYERYRFFKPMQHEQNDKKNKKVKSDDSGTDKKIDVGQTEATEADSKKKEDKA